MNTIVGSLIIIGLLCILGFLMYQIVHVIKEDEKNTTNRSKEYNAKPSPPPNPIPSPSPPPNPIPSPSPPPNPIPSPSPPPNLIPNPSPPPNLIPNPSPPPNLIPNPSPPPNPIPGPSPSPKPIPNPSSPQQELHSSCKMLEGKAKCVLGEVIPLPNPVPFPANSQIYTCKYQYRERSGNLWNTQTWTADSFLSCPITFHGEYEVDHNLKCINVSESLVPIPPWEAEKQISISSCTMFVVIQINGTIPADPDFWQSLFVVVMDPVSVAFILTGGARINVLCLQHEQPEENLLVLNMDTIPPIDLNKRILLGFNISIRGNNLDVIFIHPNNQLYKVTFDRPVSAIQTFMLWGKPSDSKHNDFLSPVKVWAVENTTTHMSTAPPSTQELSHLVGDTKKRWSHLL